ncbi:myroilysin precursor [Fusarium tjaetaba]|uniref:Myroilysin n=1 Tax=Fusarium tjaetaba TaxID=1567544 RepID=A0A8H5S3Y7_9HYPO|nr:myroilysin precursor [Fusarium tjaetaba]KAF5643431.1 myroilysin precursor [Fusarium tjaetaba]
MKVTSFLTALAGVHSVAAYEYVYLVNSVKGNEVSSGMAYYGDKSPPGNMARPSDYTDVTHGTFTYWEGKAVKATRYLFPTRSAHAPQHLVGFATLTATCGLGCGIVIAAPGYL